MKSVCSNCGGELMHGNALGACSRCGHALTGALWTLEPPSQRRVVTRSGKARSRLFLQIAAGMLAGGVASFILFGLIEAEREASRTRPNISTSHQALRPASATGLLPSKSAPARPATSAGTALLHANAPARPLGALANANADGGRSQ